MHAPPATTTNPVIATHAGAAAVRSAANITHLRAAVAVIITVNNNVRVDAGGHIIIGGSATSRQRKNVSKKLT